MRRINSIASLVLLAVFSFSEAGGQNISPSKDKFVLLTMPYNQRQLTLFKGQLQASAGYKFAVRAQSYDSEGELINLKDNGTGSVYHYYYIRLRYGLLDFIELGAETSYLKRGVRDETTTITSVSMTSSESATVNKLTETKGFGDILLFAGLRLPVQYRWFDVSFMGGLYVPSATYVAQKPANNVITSAVSANTYTVNLHYNYTNGYGVPVYMIAAAAKLNYRKFTIEGGWLMRTPMKEGKNIRWEETLAEKAFTYNTDSYSYLLSDTYAWDVSLHYQATGWFNLYLNGSFLNTRGGWTEYYGNKYVNPEKKLINLEPGFELQISPMLTVYQIAGFPLTGKNIDAPFYLFTTVSFNLFPFMR